MTNGPLAATRRSVALYAGGALAVSLSVIWAASQFNPAPSRPPPRPAALEQAPAQAAAPTADRNPPSAVNLAHSQPSARQAAPAYEASLMAELRQIQKTDPKRALELAREGNQRFPESSDAAERASIVVHSLAQLGLRSEARGEAEDMVNRYPDTEWVREVERFTGAHRHRNARVNSQGKLEFY
jgi:hypothetical protein